MKLHLSRYLICTAALMIASTVNGQTQVPNTFQSGQPAIAAEVNANFTTLESAANQNASDISANAAAGTATDAVVDQLYSSIDHQAVVDTAGAPGLNFASCPAGSIPVSATCACDGDGVTTNFGYVWACGVVGDGVDDFAVAACFEDWTFDPALAEPQAYVDVMCVSATQVDGNPAVLDSPWAAAAMPATGTANLKAGTFLEATELRLRNAISGHRNALLLKQ